MGAQKEAGGQRLMQRIQKWDSDAKVRGLENRMIGDVKKIKNKGAV